MGLERAAHWCRAAAKQCSLNAAAAKRCRRAPTAASGTITCTAPSVLNVCSIAALVRRLMCATSLASARRRPGECCATLDTPLPLPDEHHLHSELPRVVGPGIWPLRERAGQSSGCVRRAGFEHWSQFDDTKLHLCASAEPGWISRWQLHHEGYRCWDNKHNCRMSGWCSNQPSMAVHVELAGRCSHPSILELSSTAGTWM